MKHAKYLLVLTMMLMAIGCGTDIKTAGQKQIQLAIYTPLCMEVLGGSTVEGAIVQTYPCIDTERRQQWTLTPVDSTGGYQIVNFNSLMCMSVSDANPNPSTPIVQAPCYMPAIPSQVWTLAQAPLPRTGTNIISSLNKQCLDIPQGETVGETQLQVYTCTVGDPAQGFIFKTVVEGTTP